MADQQELSIAQQLKKVMEETNSTLNERIEKQEEIIKNYKKAVERLKQMAETEENIDSIKQVQIQKTKIEQELVRANYELRKLELQNLKDLERAGVVLLDQDRKKLQGLQKIVNQQERLIKLSEKAPEYLSMLFSGQGGKAISKGFADIGGSIKGQLTDNLTETIMKSKNLKVALRAVAPLAIVGLFAALAIEIGKLAVNLGNAENAFMKVTGTNEQFARSLTDSFVETRKFGASIEETSAAMGSLFNQFTDFTFQDERTRESLTKTATVLAKMGVSTDTFAQSIQNMTKAMGMSADAAGQQMLNLEKFAEELGVAPSKLASDFAGAGGELAKFGDSGVDAFKDLAIASKITGIEIQRLLNITSAFDTFEGAAVQAGKLNAALGGNFVNAMDLMMETDPAARFNMIRDSILEAGLSFDEMSYFQRNFYKDALGLSDVGELALLLSGNMDMIPGAIQKSSQEFEEAAERAKTLASFQEQLNLLFVELVPILTPVIDMFRETLKVIRPMASVIGAITQSLGGLLLFFNPLYQLSLLIRTLTGDFDGAYESISSLKNLIFHQRNSPTFFEGISMMPDMFSDIGESVDGTSASMNSMTRAIDTTPIPTIADTMATTSTSRTSSDMQTVRQPMEISLNGDKLEKFIVQVTGKFIKDVSLVS